MAESANTTGRYIVLLRHGRGEDGIRDLQRITGASIVKSDSTTDRQYNTLELNCAIVFHHIDAALIRCEVAAGNAIQMASQQAQSNILMIEPERSVRAIAIPSNPPAGTGPIILIVPVRVSVWLFWIPAWTCSIRTLRNGRSNRAPLLPVPKSRMKTAMVRIAPVLRQGF
jgi:hypothetical protein